SLLRNTFNNVTKNNYKRMLLMARDHHDKLKGFAAIDTTISTLYQQFLPAYTTFSMLYDKVNSNYSMYRGYTQQFENIIEELRSTLIRKWDTLIQVEYDQPTPQYTMLLPNGRAVFQTGAYELRLSAVNQLYTNLVAINNPNLANLITTIDTWRNTAQAARSQQQYIEAEDKNLRGQLEDARAELAIEMYGVFFGLAAYYYRTPDKVENFYELKYLQSSNSSQKPTNNPTEIVIDSNTQKTALTGDYTSTDTFKVENKGDALLQVWISNNENSTIPIDVATVDKGINTHFFANELSDGTNPMNYLIVANGDTQQGKCAIAQLI
ncbi:MAG: hypothetical protein ACRCSB_06365, partial [Bacteroidales bacterium]